ncbi:MAG: 50S ribosomal protein L9 [Clostridiales bacterium]|jgi:large subunit ribosomal protein L9|nr:50S ribosomal protein L9 [Clostridiales bacterium]
MKVILLKDVKNQGISDDVIKVSDGYARNYLFPNRLAKEATKQNLLELERQKTANKIKRKKEELRACEISEKLKEITVKIFSKAGENGKLFGSVTTKDISDELKKQFDISIDKKNFNVQEEIKNVGVYKINVKVFHEIYSELKIEVFKQ